MRLTPFQLALVVCALLALLANFWLFVALVLLFGRAALVQRGRDVASAAAGCDILPFP